MVLTNDVLRNTNLRNVNTPSVDLRVYFPDDWNYLGSFSIPRTLNGGDAWYGRGITYRNEPLDVTQPRHFLSTNSAGQGFGVYEYQERTPNIPVGAAAYDPDNYNEAVVIKEYGTSLYSGKMGGSDLTGGNGLKWVESEQRLYWNYGEGYDSAPTAGWFGYSTIDYPNTTGEGFGPYYIQGQGYKSLMDGMIVVGEEFANTYLNGNILAAGFGGYASQFGANDVSLGTSLTSFASITEPEGSSLIGTKLIGYEPVSQAPVVGRGRMNRPEPFIEHDYSPGGDQSWPTTKFTWNDGVESGGCVWINSRTIYNFGSYQRGAVVYCQAQIISSQVGNYCAHIDPMNFTPVSGIPPYEQQPYSIVNVSYPVIDPAKFEMGPAKEITSIVSDSGKAHESADGCLVNCTAHGFVADNRVQIDGSNETHYNSIWVVVSVPNANSVYIQNLSHGSFPWVGGTDTTPGMTIRTVGGGDFVKGSDYDPVTRKLYLFTPVQRGINNLQGKILVQVWQRKDLGA